jgi:hypothetical protein
LRVLVSLLLLSSFVCIVTAGSETIISDDNNFQCNLVTDPKNNTIYNGTMLLNFTLEWTPNTSISWIRENTSYSIDDSSMVPLQSKYIEFEHLFQAVNSKVESAVDVSNLEAGEHKLSITITGEYNLDNLFLRSFNASFNPIYFNVYNKSNPETSISPSTSPTVPELSWLMTLPLLLSLFSVAIVVRHRKSRLPP